MPQAGARARKISRIPAFAGMPRHYFPDGICPSTPWT
jgi:hypothetical protein